MFAPKKHTSTLQSFHGKNSDLVNKHSTHAKRWKTTDLIEKIHKSKLWSEMWWVTATNSTTLPPRASLCKIPDMTSTFNGGEELDFIHSKAQRGNRILCQSWKKWLRNVRDVTQAYKPQAVSRITFFSCGSTLKMGTKKWLMMFKVRDQTLSSQIPTSRKLMNCWRRTQA
jgi:hypothetical protein